MTDKNTSTIYRFTRNSLSTLAAQVVGLVSRFATIVILARYLSKELFGDYNYIAALVGSFQMLVDSGLNEIAIRELAKQRDKVDEYFGSVLVLKSLSTLLTLAILFVVANVVPGVEHVRLGLYLYGISLVISLFASTYFVLFRAFERMQYEAVLVLVERIIQIVLLILLVQAKVGFVQLFWANIISAIIKLIMGTWFSISRFTFPRIHTNLPLLKMYVRKALPVGVGQLINNFSLRIDIILLGFLETSEKVAIFSGAYRIVDAFSFVAFALMIAIFPTMSRRSSVGKGALVALLQRSVRLLMIVAIPLTVGVVFLARPIIFLVLGSKFDQAVPVLQILILVLIPTYFRILFAYAFIAVDQQMEFAYISGATLVLNILVDVVMIPLYGYWGACIGTIVAELLRMALCYMRLQNHLGPIPLWKPLKGLFIPNVALVAVLQITLSWSWIAGLIFSGLSYLIFLFIFGINNSERKMITKLLPLT